MGKGDLTGRTSFHMLNLRASVLVLLMSADSATAAAPVPSTGTKEDT
jgi:hypothetical protein